MAKPSKSGDPSSDVKPLVKPSEREKKEGLFRESLEELSRNGHRVTIYTKAGHVFKDYEISEIVGGVVVLIRKRWWRRLGEVYVSLEDIEDFFWTRPL